MFLKLRADDFGVILSLFGTRAGVIAALMAAQLLTHLRKKSFHNHKKGKKELMEKRAKKTRKDALIALISAPRLECLSEIALIWP